MADDKGNRNQVQEITDKLEEGLKNLFESEQYKSYLNTMSKFHNYSYNNTLLITMQKPDATLVAGYQGWQKNFERQVKKGEKGIKILAPVPKKIRERQEVIDPVSGQPMIGEDGQPRMEWVERTIPAFKPVTVFDVSQTYGEPIPELEVKDLTASVEGYQDFVKAIEYVSPVPIEYKDVAGDSKGYFDREAKLIVVQKDMPESQTLKTLVHETAHSILHNKEMEAALETGQGKDRNTREVEAESVAFTVLSHFGIDTSEYSFGYIAGWSSDKDMAELKGSLDTIRKTSAELINKIEAQMMVLEKEREAEQNITVEAEVVAEPEIEETIEASQEETISEDVEIKANMEAQLLYGDKDTFGIYQLKDDDSLHYHRFTGTDMMAKEGLSVDMENYDLIYVGEKTPDIGLDQIYEKFNIDRPDDFTGHSLSVSDVVVIHENGENKAYFVDKFGFAEMPDLLDKGIYAPELPLETEVAIKISDRYVTIQDSTEGYEYSIYNEDYRLLDGGFYENTDISIREALDNIISDELLKPGFDSQLEIYYRRPIQGEVYIGDVPEDIDYEDFMEKVEAVEQAEVASIRGKVVEREENPDKSNIVADFRAKTEEMYHPIKSQRPSEIEEAVAAFAQAEIEEYGMDAQIVNVVLSGSRCRGLEGEGSDLDMVIEYTGTAREDDMFAVLNEAGLKIEGVSVDINPIKEDKTGTLETYLPQVESYLSEKAEKMQDRAEFEKPEKERQALDHSGVTITYVVSSNGEFHDMGAYRDDITSVDEAIAVFNEHQNTKDGTVPSIGIRVVDPSADSYDRDVQLDIYSGKTIDMDVIARVPQVYDNSEAMVLVEALIEKLPDAYVIPISPEVEARVNARRNEGQEISEVAKSQEEMDEAIELAVAIDEFCYGYDTYGYQDAVDDREANVRTIAEALREGNADYMKDYLADIRDNDDVIDNVREAGKLVSKIQEYNPLAKVEELVEGNYNNIDGIINNLPPKQEETKEQVHEEEKEVKEQHPPKEKNVIPVIPIGTKKDEDRPSLKAKLASNLKKIANIPPKEEETKSKDKNRGVEG